MKKICVRVLILCSAMMMGCAGGKAPVQENTPQEDIRQEDNGQDELPTGTKNQEEKETTVSEPRIVNLLDVSGVHSDGFNQESYRYQIPQFNAESESAKAVNKRMEEELKAVIDTEMENIAGGYSLFTNSVTYEVYEYGEITAVVVSVPYPNDCMEYYAYTYDFQKDKELTNAELLALKEWSEDDFTAEVCRLQEEDFTKLTEGLSESVMSREMIKECIVNVNSYATTELPMYLDENGKLQVYIPFASIAGADWYYRLCGF